MSLLQITYKDSKRETLHYDILNIVGQAVYKTKYEHEHNHEKLKPRKTMALKWSMMNIAHPIDIFSTMKDKISFIL